MSQNTTSSTIVLAAGGTGGHIFPAEALAGELLRQGRRVVLVTDRRYQKHQSTPEAMEVRRIAAASPSGNPVKKVLALLALAQGVLEAFWLLYRLKPEVVVGFGGYPSFPTVLAATVLGIRTIVHEQNSVLGRVNRGLASRVNIIATSFSQVKGVSKDQESKLRVTGNPVRSSILALKDRPYPGMKEGGLIEILVVGGSLGASVFSDIVPPAIIALPESLKKRIRLYQQCRKEDIERVRIQYENAGVQANLATFFEDMPFLLSAAHLVIGRAGASTIFELTVAGKPSILVPYMHAMDDHQTSNATELQKSGAAVVIPQISFTSTALQSTLQDLLENPGKLANMAISARRLGQPEALDNMVKLVVQG